MTEAEKRLLLLASVKKSLRLSSLTFDDDIGELIDAAKADLLTAGAGTTDEDIPLIRQAIKFYCRANFQNGEPTERELYQKRYERLKNTIALCALYEKEDENA